jgi:wobble nucleotide-excising tRNase
VNKLSSAVKKITLNAAVIGGEEYATTFHGAVIDPTFVNFGFGNNGTGKSSVAKAIRDGIGVEWERGKSADDFNVLVYNQDFIAEHFANYNYLPGIFTLGERNIEISRQITANTELAKKHRDRVKTTAETKAGKERERSGLLTGYYETFWQTGATIREDFKKALSGKIGSKAAFANTLLQNQARPVQHDARALKELYDVAYGGTHETPDTFEALNASQYRRLAEFALLGIPVVGSTDSGFSRFVKSLNATDWIKRGLDNYVPRTKGRCPFCQQPLPLDFTEQVTACFDQHYQEDINAIKQFRGNYERYVSGLMSVLSANRRKVIYSKFSKELLNAYDSKAKALETTFRYHLQQIDQKIAEPSKAVSLDSVETVEQLCAELNGIITEYNRQVQTAKNILADIRNKKRECEQKIMELLAFTAQSIVTKYRADDKKRNDEIAALTGQITADNTAAQTLDRKNDELNRQIVSIRTAVDGINKLLRDSGFQGFELRVHEGSGQSAYRVVRPHTGKVAKNLSEGERNFIAFLYFYYLVRGSHSDNDLGKDKVVVIDDPVSSMDATVLHIVSMLVRDIADACLNQESIKGVKQVFVLTHNVHFHTKTANYLVSRYDVASYYLLRKSGNVSTIQHCVQNDPRNIGGQENFNPVPSEYAALWKEFKTVESPKSLFSLIWQILDFNFVIITEGEGGGDGLRYKVLVENRDNFIEQLPNETEDNSKLVMATKLLSYMGAGSHTNYESQYSEPGEDITQYRDAFKMIFTAMEQDQHYQMMMTETEKQ